MFHTLRIENVYTIHLDSPSSDCVLHIYKFSEIIVMISMVWYIPSKLPISHLSTLQGVLNYSTAIRNKLFTQPADEPLRSHSYATATILENLQSHDLFCCTLNSKSCILICFLPVFSRWWCLVVFFDSRTKFDWKTKYWSSDSCIAKARNIYCILTYCIYYCTQFRTQSTESGPVRGLSPKIESIY